MHERRWKRQGGTTVTPTSTSIKIVRKFCEHNPLRAVLDKFVVSNQHLLTGDTKNILFLIPNGFESLNFGAFLHVSKSESHRRRANKIASIRRYFLSVYSWFIDLPSEGRNCIWKQRRYSACYETLSSMKWAKNQRLYGMNSTFNSDSSSSCFARPGQARSRPLNVLGWIRRLPVRLAEIMQF